MRTRLDIIFTGIDDELDDNVSILIKSDIDGLENKISNHIENSPFSLINREAALRPVKLKAI